jgi:hypothetical protein
VAGVRRSVVPLVVVAAAALPAAAVSAAPPSAKQPFARHCSGQIRLHRGNITMRAHEIVSFRGHKTTVSCTTAKKVIRAYMTDVFEHEKDCDATAKCIYTVSGRHWACYGTEDNHGICDAENTGWHLRWAETDADVG